tara:strand:- start:12401 stop:12778 length:378 start_codon:yes stop_codon:yes gene_type:complete
MPQVELDYFEARYNPKGLPTIVTDVENLKNPKSDILIIKVGDDDDTCAVNLDSDMITVINRVKPDKVVLDNFNYGIEDFCEKIGVSVVLNAQFSKPAKVEIEEFEPQDDEFLLLDESEYEDEDGE